MIIDLSTLSLAQLKRAVALKEQIATLKSELAGLLGGSQPPEEIASREAVEPSTQTSELAVP